MTAGQLSSPSARGTRPGSIQPGHTWFRRFVGNRLREAGYGAFFASVFLFCQSPANSLALNDIRVLSKLGEPLRAEVVVTAAAGEVLRRECFGSVRSTGDLPNVGAVRLTLTRNINSSLLSIAGSQPMREPLSEFVLQVKCPGVPTMVKNFLIMVDPPSLNNPVSSPAVIAPAAIAPTIRAAAQTRRTAPYASSGDTIQPGSQYTVRSGDTLSTIAARVAGRPDWSVWPIAQQLYAINPGAFLLGDPNVIAEGAVVFMPRLADIDMSVSVAQIRPATAPANIAVPAPVAAPAPAAVVTPAAAAVTPGPPAAVARIMPAPAVVTAVATPLPAMQLTTRLLNESRIKVLLRAQGSPVAPAVVARTPAAAVPVSSTPEPQTEPERPDNAMTDSRAALKAGQSVQTDSGLNWLWIVIGLLTGLLMGALAAVGLFRQNLRREYEHEVREGVQRQVHADRLRMQRDQAMAATAGSGNTPVAAATMDLSPTVETATQSDHTVEMKTADGLDFELSADASAALGEPETLEVPSATRDLDLELPADTGKTGQHEVDFDLLEAAYSEDYHSEFVNPGASKDEQETASGDDAKRYYHLENSDPIDETPLPIELGEDEMGTDDDTDGDGKVVRFRR